MTLVASTVVVGFRPGTMQHDGARAGAPYQALCLQQYISATPKLKSATSSTNHRSSGFPGIAR
jgi:hypothetical protein